jgi:hypothetical protein
LVFFRIGLLTSWLNGNIWEQARQRPVVISLQERNYGSEYLREGGY